MPLNLLGNSRDERVFSGNEIDFDCTRIPHDYLDELRIRSARFVPLGSFLQDLSVDSSAGLRADPSMLTKPHESPAPSWTTARANPGNAFSASRAQKISPRKPENLVCLCFGNQHRDQGAYNQLLTVLMETVSSCQTGGDPTPMSRGSPL